MEESKQKTNTPSKNMIDELKGVLTQEIQLYENYARHLEGDTDLMIRLQTEELEASNKAKATILLKIQVVEQARQQLVVQIASETGMAQESIRITDLCKLLQEDDERILLELREKLQKVIAHIREIQDSATHLVKASLTWIDGSISNLKRLLTPSGVYNARGRVDRPDTFSGRVVENKA